MEKHLEIKTIEHKGIGITVKIDYDKGEISLVGKKMSDSNEVKFESKHWVFANRTVEYIQGWVDIFEAMTGAVKEAREDLKKFQKKKDEHLRDVMGMVDKSENRRKKINK